MDIHALKLDLVQKLLTVKKESVLEKITQILDSEVIVAYTVDGEPMTRNQYLQDLEAAELEIDSGDYLTQSDVEKRASKW